MKINIVKSASTLRAQASIINHVIYYLIFAVMAVRLTALDLFATNRPNSVSQEGIVPSVLVLTRRWSLGRWYGSLNWSHFGMAISSKGAPLQRLFKFASGSLLPPAHDVTLLFSTPKTVEWEVGNGMMG